MISSQIEKVNILDSQIFIALRQVRKRSGSEQEGLAGAKVMHICLERERALPVERTQYLAAHKQNARPDSESLIR